MSSLRFTEEDLVKIEYFMTLATEDNNLLSELSEEDGAQQIFEQIDEYFTANPQRAQRRDKIIQNLVNVHGYKDILITPTSSPKWLK